MNHNNICDAVTRSAIVSAKRYTLALSLAGLMRNQTAFRIRDLARGLRWWASEVSEEVRDHFLAEEDRYINYLSGLSVHERAPLLRREAKWIAKIIFEHPNPWNHGCPGESDKFLNENWVEFVPHQFRSEMDLWNRCLADSVNAEPKQADLTAGETPPAILNPINQQPLVVGTKLTPLEYVVSLIDLLHNQLKDLRSLPVTPESATAIAAVVAQLPPLQDRYAYCLDEIDEAEKLELIFNRRRRANGGTY